MTYTQDHVDNVPAARMAVNERMLVDGKYDYTIVGIKKDKHNVCLTFDTGAQIWCHANSIQQRINRRGQYAAIGMDYQVPTWYKIAHPEHFAPVEQDQACSDCGKWICECLNF